MKDIKQGLYAITEDGQVWSYQSNRFLKLSDNGQGYLKVNLGRGDQRYIHRLVAEAFIPNPFGYEFVNHKDENKSNNSVSNLEWCDRDYNNNYGTRNERMAKAKRTPVYCIELDKVFEGVKIAGEELGICRSSIGKCCNGKQQTAGGYHWRYYDGN